MCTMSIDKVKELSESLKKGVKFKFISSKNIEDNEEEDDDKRC